MTKMPSGKFLIPQNITFIDLETTGSHVAKSQIIEIGLIRTENGKVVKKYSKLVRPITNINPFVLDLTGISYEELDKAETFDLIGSEVLEIIKDSIIAAHNIRFDYGILRQEFARIGIQYTSKHFCTIKLSKLLYPDLRNYNLDHLIAHFNLEVAKRHRAFDDAKAIWDIFKLSKKNSGLKKFEKALKVALKEPSVPLNIAKEELDNLPESTGVYIFYDRKGMPLYIGKSINIRDRVKSHFSRDYLSPRDLNISRQIKSIEFHKTAGELGALFLESLLIKKLQPVYNRKLRLSRKLIAVKKTESSKGIYTFNIAEVSSINTDDLENLLRIFRSKSQAQDFLYTLAYEFQLCPKFLGLEKSDTACFSYHLNKCRGICLDKENKLKYNLRFLEAFTKYRIKPWPFAGPIMIKEEAEDGESFLIDYWCLLDGNHKKENYTFDYDAYKILYRFLSDTSNLRKVTTLKETFLNQALA